MQHNCFQFSSEFFCVLHYLSKLFFIAPQAQEMQRPKKSEQVSSSGLPREKTTVVWYPSLINVYKSERMGCPCV